MKMIKSFRGLTKFEWCLWLGSISIIVVAFLVSGNARAVTLIASLIGATALIFVSRGDVFGQVLTVIFSLLYALISFTFSYYGEMITYLGMTSPIAILSVVAWLKHPYEKGKSEVKVSKLSVKKKVWMVVLTIVVTVLFYFILKMLIISPNP